jgi:hypothetical protein
MRSDRRHELQQNELSAQIDKVSESIKQNATLLTTIIVGAVVIVGGGIWFMNQKASAHSNAWSRLQPNPDEKDPTMLLAQYEAVAQDNISPEITRSAYLRIGDTALFQLRSNRDQTEAPNPERREEMKVKAKAAFEKIAANPGNDVTALGRALMGLGVLSEDAGEFGKAREYYEKAKSDARLKDTPIAREAVYRIAHMNEWSAMVEFPEPVVPPLLEASEGANEVPAGTFVPPADISSIPSMPEINRHASNDETSTDDASAADDPVDESSADGAQPTESDEADTTPTDSDDGTTANDGTPGDELSSSAAAVIVGPPLDAPAFPWTGC